MLLNKLRDTNRLVKLRTDGNEINREYSELKVASQKLKNIKDVLMNYSVSIQVLNVVDSEQFCKVDLNLIQYHIDKIEKGIRNSYVELNSLDVVNSKVIELESELKDKWKVYYEAKTQSLRNTILSIQNIVPDKQEAFRVVNSLDPSKSQWPVNDVRMGMINSNIELGSSIINGLGLNRDIEMFLTKISSNDATIVDLTPSILNWIKDKKLESKIGLTFQ